MDSLSTNVFNLLFELTYSNSSKKEKQEEKLVFIMKDGARMDVTQVNLFCLLTFYLCF
jgi:hypothetical protein